MLKKALVVSSILFFGVFSADAQLTITPSPTSPTPTCLSTIESTVIAPSHYPDDNTFIQSAEGTLGVTIFFEIGPYGELASYPDTGREAMFGVGEASINRWRNNDAIEDVNDHGEQSKGGIIAVIKESDAWHHETYNGSGTLLETQRNRFYSILNGAPNSLDCEGLIGAFQIGISIIYDFDQPMTYTPPTIQNWSQVPAQDALYYGSSDFGNEQLPGVSKVNQQYVKQADSWIVPRYGASSYEENFFLLTNAQPRAGFPPFI